MHDAKVAAIEQDILEVLEPMQRAYSHFAQQLIDQQLAPANRKAARILLNEIRLRKLP